MGGKGKPAIKKTKIPKVKDDLLKLPGNLGKTLIKIGKVADSMNTFFEMLIGFKEEYLKWRRRDFYLRLIFAAIFGIIAIASIIIAIKM